MKPYYVRSDPTTVEIWAGKRIQHGDEARSEWQRALKNEIRQASSSWEVPAGATLAGHYNTTSPVITDVENSLFTNVGETLPRSFNSLRFERGVGAIALPPVPVDLVSGHLHYYRYCIGGDWTTWVPDRTVARWTRVPRRLSEGSDTARPVWFALRLANVEMAGAVEADGILEPGEKFGIRVIVHATKTRSHVAIANSEFVIDGSIAAFHRDPLSDGIVAALLPKLPNVTQPELRNALGQLAGPVFSTPAVQISRNGSVQINPADENCWLGVYEVHRDSTSQWPEFSGELFTIRPKASR